MTPDQRAAYVVALHELGGAEAALAVAFMDAAETDSGRRADDDQLSAGFADLALLCGALAKEAAEEGQ
jgi:hypothetical protein